MIDRLWQHFRSPVWGQRWACLAAGALYPLGFAPFKLWPLTPLSMALFWWLIRQQSAKQAFYSGWWYGLGLFAVGVHWIYFSLFLFGEAIAPLSFLITLIFVAILALYGGLFAALLQGVFRPLPIWGRYLVLAPALWVGVEWLRSWLFTGFPWLSAGYSQVEAPLAGWAPVLGVFGLSYWIALLAGCTLLLCLRPRRHLWVALAVAALAVGGGYGLSQRHWTEPSGQALRVALIQPNITQEQKFREETILASLRYHRRHTRYAAGEVDLVLWPETAIPTFYDLLAEELDSFGEQMRERGTHVLSGVFTYQKRGEQELYYNSVREIGGQGQTYSKRHLVPFSERIPFKGLLQFFTRFIMIPMSDLQPGDGAPEPFEIAGHRLAISICYEDAFGDEIIQQLPAATVLLNVSNDAWFGRSIAPEQHLQIAQMRALETARPMLRGTNTGVSALVDAKGRVVERTQIFEDSTLFGEVQPMQGQTPFIFWGNRPMVIWTACLIAVSLGWRRYTQS